MNLRGFLAAGLVAGAMAPACFAQVVDQMDNVTNYVTNADVAAQAAPISDLGYVAQRGLAGVHEALWAGKACAIRSTRYDPDEVVQFRAQEGLTTTLVLPSWERIVDYVISADVFEVVRQGRGTNTLTVRGKETDAGASVILFGKSGRMYSFYGRIDPIDGLECPQMVVKVQAAGPVVTSAQVAAIEPAAPVPLAKSSAPKVPDFAEPEIAKKLTFAFSMAGNAEIAPDVVFSDGVFTYLYFSPERWGVTSMPAVFRVVDQRDIPAQLETEGTTIIVKAVGPLTLRVGDRWTCVRLDGWTPGGPARTKVTP